MIVVDFHVFFGIDMFSIFVLMNKLFPRCSILELSSISIFLRFLHDVNALPPISTMLSGIKISSISVLAKANFSIEMRFELFENLTDF